MPYFAGLLLIALFPLRSAAQVNLLGKPGYLLVPSAEWKQGQDFSFNFGFLPIEHTLNKRLLMGDAVFYNSRIGVTKFLELGLNLIYPLGNRYGIGDRQIDARLLLKKETKNWPSIVFTSTLPFEIGNVISYTALSLTKNFTLFGSTKFQVTAGYSSPYYLGLEPNDKLPAAERSYGFYRKSALFNEYLSGVFGGLSWKPVPWAGIMAEYDTRDINAGLWIGYKDRIGLQYHLYGLKNSGGNFYFKVPLDFESRELRRSRKLQRNGGI